MAKVIVERPRHGGGFKYPRGSVRSTDRLAREDWHRREGIRHPWTLRGMNKGLNENLAPLRRFLRSHVGRPWDKVFAEICQRINRNSAVQLHIWQHLSDFVCTNPYEVAGEVGRRWYTRLRQDFYVDPRTGLLRRSPRLTKRQWGRMPGREFPPQPLPNPVVPINENRCYEMIDNVWYELDLRKPPASGYVYGHVTFNPRLGYRQYRGRRLYIGAMLPLDGRAAQRIGRMFRKQVEDEMAGRVSSATS
jgi:hypothetical protein